MDAVKEADLTRVKELLAAVSTLMRTTWRGVRHYIGRWAIIGSKLHNCSWRAGANVNLKDGLGLTPLLTAADTGRDGLVRLLVENGAKVNLDSDSYGLPLYRAVLAVTRIL